MRGSKPAPLDQHTACAHCGRSFDPFAHRGRRRRYCSDRCREASYRVRRAAERPTYDVCTVEGCGTRRRSKSALWCEMHYARWYRGNPVEDGRLRGGTCHHCSKPTGSKRRYYCSQLCRTRTRIGVVYDPDRRCVVCVTPIMHEERFNRNGCCSTQCSDTVRLVASYGLTIGRYREIYEAQGGKCAICRKRAARLRIDHHHGDGIVRGLLCNECNLGLGLFCDNPLMLAKAARYIEGGL
jgi:predicted nucleic acid-binding Zn ribbon protein